MPAGVHGFGYLDNIRNVLVGQSDLTAVDVKPTEQQKARLGHMYTGDRTTLATTDTIKEDDITIPADKAAELDFSKWKAMFGVKDFTNDGKTIVGTSEATDYAITYGEELNIKAEDVDCIHITMAEAPAVAMELFFTTDTATTWTQDKSVSVTVSKEGPQDYYIFTSDIALWMGTIKQLRFDPAAKPGTFTITNFEFLKFSEAQAENKIFIDSTEYTPCKRITTENDEIYTVAEPYYGFFSLLNCYYEWSRFTNKLYVLAKNGTEITFTMGSDTAIVNGKETKLPKAIELYDGLPVMPMKWFLNTIGITNYTVDGKNLNIFTLDAKFNDILNSRKPNEWEFEIEGDAEGWSPAFMTYEVGDGVFSGTATERPGQSPLYDAMMHMSGLEIDALKYDKIAIGFSCDVPGEKTSLGIYFITATDKTYDQKKYQGIDVTAADGEAIKEYILDFSEVEAWKGKITAIRVDPIGASGSFKIDYIRFVDNGKASSGNDSSATVANDAEFEIINGNAEGTEKSFFSGNAKITIVEDADKAGNHVYNVEANAGKQWSYIRHKVIYTPGATYTVSFDVKLTGTNDGKAPEDLKGEILVNGVYDDAAKSDHVIKSFPIALKDGWVHCECTYTVAPTSTLRDKDEFTIYANPVGDISVLYQVDNVVVTEAKP